MPDKGPESIKVRHCTCGPSGQRPELQNGLGRKGPLEVILSNPCVQAGLLRAGCSGLCPDRL